MVHRELSIRVVVTALLAFAFALSPGCDRKREQSKTAEPAASSAPKPSPPETGPDDAGDATGAEVQTAEGNNGAVTSAEANATRIGISILRRGGNAVDAAIAVGFALGVTHPTAGNIGGGGFMIVRLPDGKASAVDFRETAPGKASADMYIGADGNVTKDSRLGPRAAGIPGDVAGFALAHETWGTMKWKDLVTPAARLAGEGWALDENHADDLRWGSDRIAKYQAKVEGEAKDSPLAAALRETVATFRKPDGTYYLAGEVWAQPALAATLEAIADGGADAFYKGPLARDMAAKVRAMGGIWTAADLAGYRAVVREPLAFDYHGHRIITMPPPSAGGVVLRQILAAADILDTKRHPWSSPQRIHAYVESLRRVYADRNLLLGDPDFVRIPMDKLLDVSYLGKRMADISPEKATPSSEVGAGVELEESPQTTHFSVVDARGMAVAVTYTLNGGFGAKVQIPGTGVTLNNEMDDFTAKVGAPNMFGLVQGPQNSIAPKKRMLSSMSPTIVARDGKLRAVLGSPGGPTITTTVAQIALQLIDYGRPLDEAVRETRIHHQWLPDAIWHEPGLPDETKRSLEAKGHTFKTRGSIGHANCIEITTNADGARLVRAVADSGRRGGQAMAY